MSATLLCLLLGGVNLGLAALLEGHAAFLFDYFIELLSHRFWLVKGCCAAKVAQESSAGEHGFILRVLVHREGRNRTKFIFPRITRIDADGWLFPIRFIRVISGNSEQFLAQFWCRSIKLRRP